MAQHNENSAVVEINVGLGSFVIGSGSTGQNQVSKSIFKWKREARSKRAASSELPGHREVVLGAKRGTGDSTVIDDNDSLLAKRSRDGMTPYDCPNFSAAETGLPDQSHRSS